MLEAANKRRRRRGEAELTEEGLRSDVGRDLAENVKRRDEYLVDLEVQQVLDVKNERRKAKGLPPLSMEEFKAELEDPQ
jgi:hypothetical protein